MAESALAVAKSRLPGMLLTARLRVLALSLASLVCVSGLGLFPLALHHLTRDSQCPARVSYVSYAGGLLHGILFPPCVLAACAVATLGDRKKGKAANAELV